MSDRERAAIEAAMWAYEGATGHRNEDGMRAAIAAYNAALQEQGACSQCGGKRWMAKPRSPGTTVCNACNGTGKGPTQ